MNKKVKFAKSFVVGKWKVQALARVAKNKVNARKRQYMYEKFVIEDVQETHNYIFKLLTDKKPIMIGRFGFTEAEIVGRFLGKQLFPSLQYSKAGRALYQTAGFFSKDGKRINEDIDSFARIMLKASENIDLLGISYAFLEDYIVNNICGIDCLTEFDHLRIMAAENSWGRALEGKKVLVVHPFSKSIQSQYKKRERLWSNESILPKFELQTYKAVQTIGNNATEQYINWFEALKIMSTDISNMNFDIAIIGCGAYGYPLASEVKKMGKKAIHLGGQTQLIFGIRGKRWDNIPYYNQFINDTWVYPSEEERPHNYKQIENGCYW